VFPQVWAGWLVSGGEGEGLGEGEGGRSFYTSLSLSQLPVRAFCPSVHALPRRKQGRGRASACLPVGLYIYMPEIETVDLSIT